MQESTAAATGQSPVLEASSRDDLTIEERLRQFDFWLGSWNVSNTHFKDGEWVHTGDATSRVKSVAGGNGIIDQWTGVANGNELRGTTFRTFDKTVKKWVVVENWPSGRPREVGVMQGVFDGKQAEFFPPDSDAVRYRFIDLSAEACEWNLARLQDDGSYQKRWIMSFSRTGGPVNMNAENTEPVMPLPEIAGKYPEWRAFDTILGKWSGSAKRVNGDTTRKGSALLTGTTLVEGLGMLALIDIVWENGEKEEHAWMIHHSARRDNWMILRLDSTDPEFYNAFGKFDGKHGEFIERDVDGKQDVKVDWSVTDGSMEIERTTSTDDGETWTNQISLSLARE